jgi:hypothetical protein
MFLPLWGEALYRLTRPTPRGSTAGRRPSRFCPRQKFLEDRRAPAVFSVTSRADSHVVGSGALRRVIADSNATAGPNQINILTPGAHWSRFPTV